jgi:hypothetical protein
VAGESRTSPRTSPEFGGLEATDELGPTAHATMAVVRRMDRAKHQSGTVKRPGFRRIWERAAALERAVERAGWHAFPSLGRALRAGLPRLGGCDRSEVAVVGRHVDLVRNVRPDGVVVADCEEDRVAAAVDPQLDASAVVGPM